MISCSSPPSKKSFGNGWLDLADLSPATQPSFARALSGYCKASSVVELKKLGEEIIDCTMISCALDRLIVIAAGSDPKTSELFAKAELARQFCHPASVRRGAIGGGR